MLRAVIFDVDGTMAETERYGHRVAFNEAFARLGLEDRWDEELYGELLRITGGERRLRHYFENQRGVAGDEAARLAAAVHAEKTQLFTELAGSGTIPPRPGLCRLLDELEEADIVTAVATTGSSSWVEALLPAVCGEHRAARFAAVITGEDVRRRKPDPEAFLVALARLGVGADEAVAVEDSANGVGSAKHAALACLGVPGDYSSPGELADADLVVAEFEQTGGPLTVHHNPHGLSVGTAVDVPLLVALRDAAYAAGASNESAGAAV